MHPPRPTARLLTKSLSPSTLKSTTSATTFARHLHFQHTRLKPSPTHKTRCISSQIQSRHSIRYNSSDSSPSDHKKAAYQPIGASNKSTSSETPRWEATHPSSKPSWVAEPSGIPDPTPSARPDEPAYALAFTCKPRDYECGHRAWHRVSKQGYHQGTVLIKCPGCGGRHLISDHLRIFSDRSITIEDLMKTKGELVKRGSISGDSDVEFWDDDAERRKELERAAGMEKREADAIKDGYVK